MAKASATKEGDRSDSQGVAYPKHTLQDALRIAEAIHEKYNGKPMPPKSLAEAVGLSWGTGGFRTLLAASARYGLTVGSYNAPHVDLTDIARAIFSPRSSEEKAEALAEAARKPDGFGRVYKHYEGSNPPEEKFFLSILERDFGVPRKECKRFSDILHANTIYTSGVSTTRKPSAEPATPEVGDEEQPAAEKPLPSVSQHADKRFEALRRAQHVRVFISHSKNESILEIIRTTMELTGFYYEIAEKEETEAKPVPQKVLDAMRRCTAAIVSVSADDKEKRGDGTYGVNQNVLIEIGAAFVLYDPHIVLVWDKRVTVPSNLQGLYRCEYEGDELPAHALLKLQKAIANFRPETPT